MFGSTAASNSAALAGSWFTTRLNGKLDAGGLARYARARRVVAFRASAGASRGGDEGSATRRARWGPAGREDGECGEHSGGASSNKTTGGLCCSAEREDAPKGKGRRSRHLITNNTYLWRRDTKAPSYKGNSLSDYT